MQDLISSEDKEIEKEETVSVKNDKTEEKPKSK